MKTATIQKRILSVLLACAMLLPCLLLQSSAAQAFHTETSAVRNPDGSYRLTMESFQTGSVAPTDIVLVLDVSGSMEHNTPVAVKDILPTKDYYVQYLHVIEYQGRYAYKQDYIKVHNTAAIGEPAEWYAQLESEEPAVRIYPAAENDQANYCYEFYTGAMDTLRNAATSFVQSIADNAETYGADHRIAIVEFSSPTAKNGTALNTHTATSTPFYANILSGDGTASGALVSAKNQKDSLDTIITDLTASGATYSDDALTQAQSILDKSSASGRSQVVVLFTDGGPGSYGWLHDTDNSALSTANSAIECASEMKQDGVKIYTIGVFNSEDSTGTVGAKNATYLNAVSSDFPNATDMDNLGDRTAEAYSSIGDLSMNLNGVFEDISSIIGVPVDNAMIRYTLSEYFYLNAAQKKALQDAYPGTVITENADGTTTICTPNIDFPPVATDDKGEPLDPASSGIVKLTVNATAREILLGGKAFQISTADCGIYTEGGEQIASFSAQEVDVPFSETVLQSILGATTKTFTEGDSVEASDLYTKNPVMGVDRFTCIVKDEKGNIFTGGTLDRSRTFTVIAEVIVGKDTYTVQKTFTVTPAPNDPVSVEIAAFPTKRSYFVGDSLDLTGLKVNAVCLNGARKALTASDWIVTPTALTSEGTQQITVDYMGLTTTFTVTVNAVKPVRATVVSLPTKSTYVYKETPNFSGLTVKIIYNNGTEKVVDKLSDMTIQAQNNSRVRRGAKTYNVTVDGMRTSFSIQYKLVWWQWLILILLFGWIWY